MIEEKQSSSKAVLVVIVAIIVLLGIAILVKGFAKHKNTALTYQTTHPATQAVTTPVPSSTQHAVTTNNSDAELSQDEKDIQDNFNKLNGDINNVDQGFSNASADTPPQQ